MKYGHLLKGVNFGRTIKDQGEMVRAKRSYALKLRTKMQNGEIKLFDYKELKYDLYSIP